MNNNPTNLNAGWKLDNSYANLPERFMTRLDPTPVASPQLVVWNDSLAKSLGLHTEALQSPEGMEVLAGNLIPPGSEPLAQAYAGHQFGHFTMLGDGRAVLLGEQITPSGERLDIQLKGSGPTPYSRSGDGRAALGPMLREYIISEAMHGLGIPTTRSLAVVETGEAVYRETKLPGAILTRVAASHLRVGTFEYAAHFTEEDELQALADYAIQRHYPELMNAENRYVGLLKGMIARQAELIAQWQLVGFIHGVMNTDNMAVSGETIDYGPCAFMDQYDPMTVFSSIDTRGRYAYGNQPYIGGWNLSRFAEALLPLLDENQDQERAVQLAQEALDEYSKIYLNYWMNGMRAKLGLFDEKEADKKLFDDLLRLMHKYGADYTNTFLALTFDQMDGTVLAGAPEYDEWLKQWKLRLEQQPQSREEAHHLMRSSNPAVIPRNHRVEEALEAAVERNDLSVMQELLKVLADPYAHTPEQEAYASPPEPSACAYRTYCGT